MGVTSSMNIQREVIVNITLEPRDLAKAFWSMKDNQQAEFFNWLAMLSEEQSPTALNFQMAYVSSHPHLMPAGRRVMQVIGDGG